MSKRDYYDVLGISKSAPKDEVKKSYRKLAMKYHPDRNPDNPEAEAKFKEASEAASILLDDEKKSRYDQLGHAGVDGQAGGFGGAGGFEGFSGFGDFSDIFSSIFEEFSGGRSRHRGGLRPQMGADLEHTVQVTFEEASFGVKKVLNIGKMYPCDTCHGSRAKAGTSPQDCQHCHGRGVVRRQQGFFTMETTCPICRGEGRVIVDKCPSCRGEGRVRRKSDLEVDIPAGINHGQRLKLTGEGEAGLHRGPSGDLFVMIHLKPARIV